MVFAAFADRIFKSIDASNLALEERVAADLQPEFPYANKKFLIGANLTYLIITTVLYNIMKRREKRFNMKPIIVVYNFICVCLAGYVVVGIAAFKLATPGTFVCNLLEPSNPRHVQLGFVFWVFYAQKFWEFCDTWFFILRKSFRQVTFLHLFHHSSITIVVGSIIPYAFSGDMYLPIFLNSVVHVLMYSHYLVTALGFRSWWRQYLTTMQLLQFILISVQSMMSLYIGSSCGDPDWANVLMVIYMASMLVLFGNFFVRRYILHTKALPPACLGVIKSDKELAGTKIYRGLVQVDGDGMAHVDLPKLFALAPQVHRDFCYTLTPIGAAMPNLHIAQEIAYPPHNFSGKRNVALSGGGQDAAIRPVTRLSFTLAGAVPHAKVSWHVTVITTVRPSGDAPKAKSQ